MPSTWLSTTSTATPTTSNAGTLANDSLVNDGPDDSISSISWSPRANHLAVSSWDNLVRIYNLSESLNGSAISLIRFDKPVLSCDWSQNGAMVVGAGVDKSARLVDLAANGAPAQQVAVHDEPIKAVRFFEAPNTNAPMIATGSWDKTIKYWDLRSSTPAATLVCSERVYSMDAKGQSLMAVCADRKVHAVNLSNPTAFLNVIESKLQKQPRVVTCVWSKLGFALGSVEGRVEINYLEEKYRNESFSFRCHRNTIGNTSTSNVDVYAVNAVSAHPIHGGVFSTAGSDGTFSFWDVEARHRLKGFPATGGTISATGFNGDGSLFAYAVSYDWSKGFSQHTPQYPNKIMIHPVQDECKPKSESKKR